MTDAASLKPNLGRYGVWLPTRSIKPELAARIESLGYGAVWIGGSPEAELDWVEPALAATTSLQLATGIVNIWTAPAAAVAAAFNRIESAYPGRFLLGVGVGHPEHTQEYVKPYDALVGYLDELDAAGVPTSRRVLAALGPRVLELAAQRSAGAHPYLTTPEHTAKAHGQLGRSVFLAPEHKVVLTTDRDKARTAGRGVVEHYLGLSNYVNNWRRLGFTEDDVRKPGSDRLIDAVVAYGTGADISKRLDEHLQAGADHVTIQVLGAYDADTLLPALSELAGPLGLTPPG
ncbi:Flavin-dependent oxidoreductase, luciferase family (includes alkanesulfonate monooxygenase SsuD and methylene tetrahydromethanopterin reductase) [Mycobacterium rhizamassiliense]|jgi:probable F420-dependent oxidoreductase|uniref:Flavin-dependent oxidoreductase, luciferase family (Includes alkanesulfonate monooxygenase SsuD and methylene tetrahydromethanopterin reductase) n=1 Tax=Mycobacterium rhizamassiliense TaxID=1841860 RepID=A0A2U3NMW0_9MYCO|nr:LLM class F420-dependent oxidoreductase [Mycobacterium rhizamassiliense]SPM32784.1 Flavin-dependent oxidoreductase, luciferase family (includes alkanesulfonate monooxygenase SsuD and methylene tetrahydromethanopterin reductase) [Mycobacterium rhizamassiliense]